MSKKHQKQQEQRQRRKLSDHDRNLRKWKNQSNTVTLEGINPNKNLFHMNDVMSPSANHKSMNRMNRMNLEWYDNVRQSINIKRPILVSLCCALPQHNAERVSLFPGGHLLYYCTVLLVVPQYYVN